MLHKSGERPRNRVDPTCRNPFTMIWDIGLKLGRQDLAFSEGWKDITYAFMNFSEVSQVKLFHQVRSPYISYLRQSKDK
ncbi:MAG: hypothetical protein C4581_04420 [Nitrospiraceae bacterium]|nr:MAG: hypothetical protein C4581_04420 [Nitrospiraceae bacterium]